MKRPSPPAKGATASTAGRKPQSRPRAPRAQAAPDSERWKLPVSIAEALRVAELSRTAAARILADTDLCAWMLKAGVPARCHVEVADKCAEVLTYLRTPRPKDAAAAGRSLASALDVLRAELQRFEQVAGVELRVEDESIRAFGWRHSPQRPTNPSVDARPRMPLSLYLRGCVDWLSNDYCQLPTWNPLAHDPSDPNGRPPNDTYDVLRFLYQLLMRYGMGERAHRRNAITARVAGHVTGTSFEANDVAKANAAPGVDGNPVRRRNSKE